MEFTVFSNAVTAQFQKMSEFPLFRSSITKDELWETYLGSFPEGSNPIYRERTEHDCQCCRSFIRAIGDVVCIRNGKLVSLWDVEVGGPYQAVADALAQKVREHGIDNYFLHPEASAGVQKNFEQTEDGVVTWNHFFLKIANSNCAKTAQIGPRLASIRATHDVCLRGLKELTLDAIDTVIELIEQNSLYRGAEHLVLVKKFREYKVEFDKLDSWEEDLFTWEKVANPAGLSFAAAAAIRNTVIGTLLIDLSEGKDLEYSVAAFEKKVAPANYKRPTALVTNGMIEKAEKTVEDLGLTSALERRYAHIGDITVNNILFVDRESRPAMKNVFGKIANMVPENLKKLDKIEEVSIETFLENILPKTISLDVLFENKHAGNLVSLVAPVDPESKQLFKWSNGFSWSYTGDLADSLKERVKQAGGKVDGDFRASLSWFNHDDLDLHLTEPGGQLIYFRNRISPSTQGQLDVDMNARMPYIEKPVENIFYPNRSRMLEGEYVLVVHNFSARQGDKIGFQVEIEFDGVVHSFNYPRKIPNKGSVEVARFSYSHKAGVKILKSIPASETSKTIWGLQTQIFHKVNVAMLSPNYWDNQKGTGNRHFFFMLEGCQNDGQARGFFNEFLKQELDPHRKVLEMVGSKMKTESSDRQLSGLGFSSTQRNHLVVRVQGSFSRILKINF